jgi:hypothetical protein
MKVIKTHIICYDGKYREAVQTRSYERYKIQHFVNINGIYKPITAVEFHKLKEETLKTLS